MGKETKIGLAVIGVLLSVFGVLLFRHFLASHAPPAGTEHAQAPIVPLSSAGMSKPRVVVASKDSAGIRSTMWDEPTTVVEPAGQAPTESYMPADPYAAGDKVSQRADEFADEANEVDADFENGPDFAPARPPTASPFQNSSSEPGVVSEDQALELPQTSPQSRNPLRKLSAEMPLDSDQEPLEDAAGTPEMELPAADPYAEPEPTSRQDPFEIPNAAGADAEPTAPNDPFSTPEYTPVDPDETDPNSAEPATANGFHETPTAPAASAAKAKSDPFGRFAAEPSDRSAAEDDWRAGPAVARSAVEPAAVLPANEQPLPVQNGLYTVQPGDTLWSISEKVYGTGGYFKALAAQNRSILPRSDQLTVGSQVAVPPTTDLERDFPNLCPKERKSALVRPQAIPPAATQRRANRDVYIVAEGDTLFDIARYELGKASRWAEIYELNRDLLGEDFDYLRPGTELVMPPSAETATRPATSRY